MRCIEENNKIMRMVPSMCRSVMGISTVFAEEAMMRINTIPFQ